MKLYIRTNILTVFIGILMLFALVTESRGQEDISGSGLNIYAKVDSVGVDYVRIVSNPGFAVNDTVLLIQMKGVGIRIGETTPPTTPDQDGSLYGNGNLLKGRYGWYEFLIIESFTGSGPYRAKFRSNLIDNLAFNPEAAVQMIKVPSYGDAVVSAELTTAAWDSVSGTGGVLAMIVGRTLTLNANINVSGKGFRGGTADLVAGACVSDGWNGAGLNAYPYLTNAAGIKGEGIASHIEDGSLLLFADHARGYGNVLNAGGGGNGKFGGGGGGGNRDSGNPGGGDDCINLTGGQAGSGIETALGWDPVVMGGGGGASGYISGPASHGGNGGGIIFILADSLIGGGFSIISSGESVATVPDLGTGGAGGAGAGGSVVLSIGSVDNATNVNINATGGRGGHSRASLEYNYGGGGGGGLVYANPGFTASSSVAESVSGGNNGIINYPTALPGADLRPKAASGDIDNNLALRLNGFLFNTIQSSVSQTDIDSICSNQFPYKIIGTQPVGGTPGYTYLWQRSYDNNTWLDYPGTTDTRDLIPDEQETDTVWFRRVVTDSGAPALTDTSKAIVFYVQPDITGNIIGYSDTICEGQDPIALNTIGAVENGNGIYSFNWFGSDVNTSPETWLPADGTSDSEAYDPPSLITTMYYYREVISGVCRDTSLVDTITVLTPINSNTISADQVICEDRLFTDLTGSVPGGGDGSYRYEWRISDDDNLTDTYANAAGTFNQQNYNPVENTFARDTNQYFRRYVYSGAGDVCKDSSDVVILKMWSDISGNELSSVNTTHCAGDFIDPITTLASIIGGDPGQTNGFIWEKSIDNLSWTNTGVTTEDFPGEVLTDTTWYRRIVTQTECYDTSAVFRVDVHYPILDFEIQLYSGGSDTTLCSGGDPNILNGLTPTGGDLLAPAFYWEESIDNTNWVPAIGTNNSEDYDPGVLTGTTYYRRTTYMGECEETSSVITVNILPSVTGNSLSADQMVCFNTTPDPLTTVTALGGGDLAYSFAWEESINNVDFNTASGVNATESYSPPPLTVETYYRRIVTSGPEGCCVDISDTVSIGIWDLPEGTILAVPDDTTCAGEEVNIGLSFVSGLAPYDFVIADANGANLTGQSAGLSHSYSYYPEDPYDYLYTLASVTDANGCLATVLNGTQNHKVYAIPDANAGLDFGVCGLTAVLNAVPSVGTGTWTTFAAVSNSFTAANVKDSEVSVGDYGSYIFHWTERNWQCTDSDSVEVSFFKPVDSVIVDAGPDTTLAALTTNYIMSATPLVAFQEFTGTWSINGENINDYISSINDPVAVVENLIEGDYRFTWTVTNGSCPAKSDNADISVRTLVINPGFSPNNDGINDRFIIDGLEKDGVIVPNELVITDMTGTLVYRMKNYDNMWDGRDMKNGDPLPDGTYYYFLNIEGRHISQMKGYLILKRSY